MISRSSKYLTCNFILNSSISFTVELFFITVFIKCMKGILFRNVLGSLLPSRPKGTDLVPQTNDALFSLWSLLTLGQVESSCRTRYCWYEKKKCWCETKCSYEEKCRYLSDPQRQCAIPV